MADGDLSVARALGEAGAKRPERPALLAFVNDAGSEAVLREGLAEFAPEGLHVRRMSCAQAVAHLRKSPTPRILIVDVSGEEQPINALLALSEVVEPDVRVLVIGDREDINFYRQLTRGLCVLEYLYKPLVRTMVARHFGPWIGDGVSVVEPTHGGRVISVTGASGGSGSTTVAVNLAWHFATEIRRHTLLLDPNLHTGHVALALGVKGDTGLRTALELPDRVDELFVERSAQLVVDRLSVLSSEEKLGDRPAVSPGAAQHLLNTVRRRYNFVIVDAPFRPDQAHRDFLDLSHQRVIVMDPTLASVRDALRLLQLAHGPTQSRRALLVVNQVGRPGSLALPEIEQALGLKPDVRIPYLPRVLGQAAIATKPAVSNRGPFRDAIVALGQEAAFVRPAAESEASRPGARRLWGRLVRART